MCRPAQDLRGIAARITWVMRMRGSGRVHTALVPALLLAFGGVPLATAASGRTLSDGVLRVPLPGAWFGGIGPGVERGKPVAWLLAGNFAFAPDYPATHEGIPPVPPGKLLVVIGDFVVVGPATQWPTVRRVRLPSNPRRLRDVSWNVRFAGRALRLSAHFGSRPSAATTALAGRILAGIRHV